MKKITPFLLALFILVLYSCEKSDNEPIVTLGFSDLKSGDEMKYVFFEAESYWEEGNDNFSYREDTLVLKVIEVLDDGGFVISESITEGSSIFSVEESYYWGREEEVFTNVWRIDEDSLILSSLDEERFYSHLFFGRMIPLALTEFTENMTMVKGWKTSFPYTEGNHDLYALEADILNINYDQLNVAIRNTPMAYDAPGATYFYNKTNGVARTSTYSWWTSVGQGWDRLVE